MSCSPGRARAGLRRGPRPIGRPSEWQTRSPAPSCPAERVARPGTSAPIMGPSGHGKADCDRPGGRDTARPGDLRPIWSTKPETASRVRGRIEAICRDPYQGVSRNCASIRRIRARVSTPSTTMPATTLRPTAKVPKTSMRSCARRSRAPARWRSPAAASRVSFRPPSAALSGQRRHDGAADDAREQGQYHAGLLLAGPDRARSVTAATVVDWRMNCPP